MEKKNRTMRGGKIPQLGLSYIKHYNKYFCIKSGTHLKNLTIYFLVYLHYYYFSFLSAFVAVWGCCLQW